MVGPFLLEMTVLERGATIASERSSAAVPLVEPIEITLSSIPDCDRFHRLDH
jgi:hypothetical protein